MSEIIELLEAEYDEHYWQCSGLQGACDGIAQWHFGYAEGIRKAIELLRKEGDQFDE